MEDKKNILIVTSEELTISNIWHVFGSEIGFIAKTFGYALDEFHGVCLVNHDSNNKPNMWRLRIMQSLFKEVYLNNLPAELNDTNCIFFLQPQVEYLVGSPHFFMSVDQCQVLQYYTTKIKMNMGIAPKSVGTEIVFIKRKENRVLYDMRTQQPLDEVLSKFIPALKIYCFDDMTAEEQARAVSEAKVLIGVHGAALTNMIFLPANGKVIEVNFRRHWTCDPLCERHACNELPVGVPCQDVAPYFHKADHFSLSQLLGLKYEEVEMSHVSDFPQCCYRNPILWRSIYVDPDDIISKIEQ